MANDQVPSSHGRMGQMIREFDWAATPLGPFSAWHAEMKSWVGFIVESHFPHALVARRGLVTIYNDAFAPILGNKHEALGRSFADVWAEVWDEIGPIAERAFEGEATFIEDLPLTINRYGAPEKAWFTFCYAPLRLSDGSIVALMDTVVETTATVRARQQLDLLNDELSHRIKNSTAIVQAIAKQTLRDIGDAPSVTNFLRRVAAIGDAQAKLLRHDAQTTKLSDIISGALSPIDGLRQVRAHGPEINVGPHFGIALTMVLFELATNAAKYGALSTPRGQITLAWSIEGENLALIWRESGGPTVKAPTGVGFGSSLIDHGLGSEAHVQRRYPETGFEADLEMPLLLLQR